MASGIEPRAVRLFSLNEKQVAQKVVAGISGAMQVVNEIRVE